MLPLRKTLSLLLVLGVSLKSKADYYSQCDEVELNTFLMIPDDCAAYVYCNGDDSFRDSCPDQTYFDAQAQECAFDDEGLCMRSKKNTTTQATEISSDGELNMEQVSTIVVTTTASTGRPQCNVSGDSYQAHPERCEYYYRCISGYLTIVRCPYSFGWDYTAEQCRPIGEAQCFK
ncbi:uncharacterized protein LOC115624858 [Scaptodrosophila lebanonensis]|uniref:Uncharacterized protein LOC115624858 n=1 Tax=Drosophila lebanonensis TaxID=7225 RepID=A0A6J2TK93_DROLE|nr:uncharacterized protein LOC115624858 [Scaptodrosophila lebanonensis]